MNNGIERDLGEQPIAKIINIQGLKSHGLVSSSNNQISHKMVSRAMKGRRLTKHVQIKILNALNNATKRNYSLQDLFKY